MNQLHSHIVMMLEEYRNNGEFSPQSIDHLMYLADFVEDLETSTLINKLHYIITRISSNGGIPVLKQIITKLEGGIL